MRVTKLSDPWKCLAFIGLLPCLGCTDKPTASDPEPKSETYFSTCKVDGRTFWATEKADCGQTVDGPSTCHQPIEFLFSGEFHYFYRDVVMIGEWECVDTQVQITMDALKRFTSDAETTIAIYDADERKLQWGDASYVELNAGTCEPNPALKCYEGASCCPDNQWRCNSGSGTRDCMVLLEKLPQLVAQGSSAQQ